MLDRAVQVYRRTDGGFAVKADAAPLVAGQMLIARGLSADEAVELIEELSQAALGQGRGVNGHG